MNLVHFLLMYEEYSRPDTEMPFINCEKVEDPPWENPMLLKPSDFPSYFRPTTTSFPRSPDLYEKSCIPLGVSIIPGNVQTDKVYDLSKNNIIRCRQCNAFLSQWAQLINGKTWKCPICDCENIEFINENLSERPEMKSSVVDIIAPPQYVDIPDICPSFMFLIDISQESISKSFAQTAAKSILASFSSFSDETMISLVTFSNAVTVYDLSSMKKSTFVDLEEMNVAASPFKFGLVKENFRQCLTEIIESKTEQSGNCFGNGIKVAATILKKTGGLILAFVASIPSIGPYRVTPSKAQVFKTNNAFYQKIANDFIKSGISVSLFSKSSEMPTLGVLPGLTGGKCYYYNNENYFLKLHREIFECLSIKYLWDTNLRLRISDPLIVKMIHGNLSLRDRNLISIPVLDPHDSITFEFSLGSHITKPNIVLQFALVFTNEKLQRIVRIFTFSVAATSKAEILFKNVDEAAVSALILKRGIVATLSDNLKNGRKSLLMDSTNFVTKSRLFVISPHITHALMYNSLFYDTNMSEIMSTLISLRALNIVESCLFAYPRLISISDGSTHRLKREELKESLMVLHQYDRIIIYAKDEEEIRKIVDYENDFSIILEKITDEKVKKVINDCLIISGRFLPIVAVVGETNFAKFMIEDKYDKNTLSFVNSKI